MSVLVPNLQTMKRYIFIFGTFLISCSILTLSVLEERYAALRSVNMPICL